MTGLSNMITAQSQRHFDWYSTDVSQQLKGYPRRYQFVSEV